VWCGGGGGRGGQVVEVTDDMKHQMLIIISSIKSCISAAEAVSMMSSASFQLAPCFLAIILCSVMQQSPAVHPEPISFSMYTTPAPPTRGAPPVATAAVPLCTCHTAPEL
jgi:hypothetical protein